MDLTLSDVVQMDVMAQAEVVGGTEGLGRPVNGVAVIETPVEDFVKAGQLVLTTAMGSGRDDALLLQFAEEIRSSGASGLAVAVGKYVDHLGPEVVAWADGHGFPLIELPWELPFASIVDSVLQRIMGDELRLLKQSDSIRRSLTTVLVESRSLPEIARALEAALGRPVLVLDSHLRLLASSYSTPAGGGLASTDAEPGRASARSVMNSPQYGRVVLLKGLSGYEKAGVVAVPVVASGELLGYLGLVGGEDLGVTQLEQSTLGHACAVAAIYFLRERAVAETKLRLTGDFVWSLAMGRIADEAEALLLGHNLGYRLGDPSRAVLFSVDGGPGPHKPGDDKAEKAKDWLGEVIQQTISRSAKQVMLTYREGLYVCFVEELAGGESGYPPLVRQVRDEVMRHFRRASVSCGIGGLGLGLRGFARSYDEAKKALRFGRVLGEEQWFGFFPQLLTLRIILDAAKSEDAASLIERFLGPLSDHGDLENSESFRTLLNLMETGWNVSAAARRLHIHRQTLLYRLDRIRASVDWDISKPTDRFAFQFAVYLHLLTKKRATDPQAEATADDNFGLASLLASAGTDSSG